MHSSCFALFLAVAALCWSPYACAFKGAKISKGIGVKSSQTKHGIHSSALAPLSSPSSRLLAGKYRDNNSNNNNDDSNTNSINSNNNSNKNGYSRPGANGEYNDDAFGLVFLTGRYVYVMLNSVISYTLYTLHELVLCVCASNVLLYVVMRVSMSSTLHHPLDFIY